MGIKIPAYAIRKEGSLCESQLVWGFGFWFGFGLWFLFCFFNLVLCGTEENSLNLNSKVIFLYVLELPGVVSSSNLCL